MEIQNLIIALPVLFFAIVIHEFAHGWMAGRCGDLTARQMGRLTLNPLAHIDPMGTVLLPIFLVMIKSPILFGWAKPVPINPLNFRNPKRDIIWVGLAGPLTNLMVALICSLILRLPFLGLAQFPYILLILEMGVFINLIFAVFNLIPVPPLDGSRILVGLLPHQLAYKFSRLDQYGFIILIALLYLGIINFILGIVVTPLYNLLMGGIGV
ncbi:MAG: site-2 protease family protein [bacterium]